MSVLLAWPADFPPRTRVKKFFLGVRWLGPDLSFFRELRARQARRTESSMSVWENDAERELALRLGHHFRRALGWATPYFLPDDELRAVAYGPRFRSIDDLLYEEAIIAIERDLGITRTDAFWTEVTGKKFGDLVAEFVKFDYRGTMTPCHSLSRR